MTLHTPTHHMLWHCLCLTTVVIAVHSLSLSDCEPPRLINGSAREIFFVRNGILELPCTARGTETLEYSWLKNSEELVTNPLDKNALAPVPAHSSTTGSLTIAAATGEDEGYYQCRVRNRCGTVLSDVAWVREARLELFEAPTELDVVTGVVGEPLKLSCRPPYSAPEATISWGLVNDQPGAAQFFRTTRLILDDRVTMDYHGNLYFTSLRKADEQAGRRYVCVASNLALNAASQGGETKVVASEGKNSRMLIDFLWHSEERVVVPMGGTARFKCIFSGNPQPSIRWERTGGELLSPRMTQSEDMFELRISDVELSDAGHYTCVGLDALDKNEQMRKRFTLSVESAPVWQSEPGPVETGNTGQDAVFSCRAEARPEPTVQWFANGLPVSGDSLHDDMMTRDDLLIVTNVSASDPKVIQCNVSNTHGYLWADFYLRSVEPITSTTTTSTTTSATTSTPTTTTTTTTTSTTTTSIDLVTAVINFRALTSVEAVTSRAVTSLDSAREDGSGDEEEAVSISPVESGVSPRFHQTSDRPGVISRSQTTTETPRDVESSSARPGLAGSAVLACVVTLLWTSLGVH